MMNNMNLVAQNSGITHNSDDKLANKKGISIVVIQQGDIPYDPDVLCTRSPIQRHYAKRNQTTRINSMHFFNKILFTTFVVSNISYACASPDPVENSDLQYKDKKTICIIKGAPSFEHKSIKNFKLGKATYGSVNDILPKFLNYADDIGGNTITNYSASQRFGFWPWRFIRPVARGTIINWPEKTDSKCISAGGMVYLIETENIVNNITALISIPNQDNAPTANSLDTYDELEKLDKLRKSGIITEDEFKTQKTKILNRP